MHISYVLVKLRHLVFIRPLLHVLNLSGSNICALPNRNTYLFNRVCVFFIIRGPFFNTLDEFSFVKTF